MSRAPLRVRAGAGPLFSVLLVFLALRGLFPLALFLFSSPLFGDALAGSFFVVAHVVAVVGRHGHPQGSTGAGGCWPAAVHWSCSEPAC